MDNTGRENGDHDQEQGSPADEPVTSSGWVVTKEAPEPTEKPVRAQAGGRPNVRTAGKKKAAPARKRPSAVKRAASGKKKAAARTGKKKAARPAGKKKAARKSGKRKVR